MIRTGGNPLRSRPSRALTATVLTVALVGLLLPYAALAGPLGFVPLPMHYLLFVFAATAVYLALVEELKRRLLRYPTV